MGDGTPFSQSPAWGSEVDWFLFLRTVPSLHIFKNLFLLFFGGKGTKGMGG